MTEYTEHEHKKPEDFPVEKGPSCTESSDRHRIIVFIMNDDDSVEPA